MTPIDFGFAWTTTALLALAAVALSLLAAWLRRRRKFPPLVWTLVAVAVFVGALLAPSVAMDRIRLDDTGVAHRTGFWFAPTHKVLAFDGLREVVLRRLPCRGGRGRVTQCEHTVATYADGRVLSLRNGDLWRRHDAEIVAHLRDHGVALRDER